MPERSVDLVGPNVTDQLRVVIDEAGITSNTDLVARILATGVGLGIDRTSRLDLKITSAALGEMREAFQLFAAYAGVPKVTIFGSARTRPEDPTYRQAVEVASELAARGWLVVTGAGPGIMEAGVQGAGPDRSLGVSIRLPFEEKPNADVAGLAHNVAMKYFFTRKLMLVKESLGFVCLPGGFGTLDEMFELLTLQQTGKAEPMPIVLLDRPGGTMWSRLAEFVEDELETNGLVTRGDFDRVLVTDSVAAAVEEITGFWRNYDSLRWVRDRLVLRLRAVPTDAEVERLNEEFAPLLASGRIERTGPLPAEVADGDELEAPRLLLHLAGPRVGELHRLIRAINRLDTAPLQWGE